MKKSHLSSFFFVVLLGVSNAQANDVEPCLSQVKDKTFLIKQCKINQVLPGECDKLLQPSVLLTLQCARNGASKQQINAAIARGESRVAGNENDSPYIKLKHKLESSPYFITPEKENFIAYSRQCSDYKEKLFKIVAQSIQDGQAKFIVSPMKPTSCLTTTNLDKKYPVLSASQLEKFKQAYYLEQRPSAERPYEVIEIMIADSMADAGKFFSRMTKRAKLTINTEPENASIKIIGMKKAYKKGMKLNVGQYKIRVTSPTYVTQELIINLEEHSSNFDIKLVSSIEQINCQENQQGFPLEFINQHYLKKINNCTYQLTGNSDTNTPFKLLVTKNTHESKDLITARLGIMNYDHLGNMSSLIVEELKPRMFKVSAGSSGISDVPQAIQEKHWPDEQKVKARLTILDATFSY